MVVTRAVAATINLIMVMVQVCLASKKSKIKNQKDLRERSYVGIHKFDTLYLISA
jgi:hypothetical protein